MRIFLPLAGAVVGAGVGEASSIVFSTIFGAVLGYALAELGLLHAALRAYGEELKRLKQRLYGVRREFDAPQDERSTPQGTAPPAVSGVDTSTASARMPPAPLDAVTRMVDVADTSAMAQPATPLVARGDDEIRGGGRRDRSDRSDFDEFPGIAYVRRFFTGGNTLVRVGVIVLFFGVAFLLRYMAEHTHVPIEVRLSGVVLGGLILLALGWRLRVTRPGYALALQGAAIGVLYLTIFAALRLFGLLPPGIAFAALVLIALLSAALAVLQNSQSFALLGITGGFLAPLLASSGDGSHVTLFTYYAILNLGLVTMSWFKAWRALNVAGFVFTFAVGAVWGALKYDPALFTTTEPFLIFFFLVYFTVAILFSLRQPPNLRGYVDATLVFGTPLAAFGLQSALLRGQPMELAFSALAVSGLYLCTAALLRRRRDDALKILLEACLALGVLFFTVAIPLALDQRWSAVGWAFEGTALVWIGVRQGRMLARISGAVLNVAAGYFVLREFNFQVAHWWLAPDGFFAISMMSAAAIASACLLTRARDTLRHNETAVPALLYLYGVVWWVLAGLAELDRYVSDYFTAASLAFLALCAVLSSEVCQRNALTAARNVALLLLPLLFVYAAAAIEHTHPFAALGWAAWPIAFASWYLIMHRHEGAPRTGLANTLNTASMWLLCAIAGWECGWLAETSIAGGADWQLAASVLPAVAMLYSMPSLTVRVAWPFARHRELYLSIITMGVAFALSLWSLGASVFVGGDSRPLRYLPLLNPVDLMQAAVLLGLLRYVVYRRATELSGRARLDPRLPYPAIAALMFVWLNAVLLRTLHHVGGVPYEFDTMFASTLVQTSVSIFWAIIALSAMVVAGRRGSRPIWIAGAVLMGVVIGKLFLIDLSRVGSIERIVSFLGVGGLMLIVGYLSPLPPAVVDEP